MYAYQIIDQQVSFIIPIFRMGVVAEMVERGHAVYSVLDEIGCVCAAGVLMNSGEMVRFARNSLELTLISIGIHGYLPGVCVPLRLAVRVCS